MDSFSFDKSKNDDIIWKLDVSGKFSCKSYFSWLVEDNSSSDSNEIGMVFWKANVPPEVQIFAWTVALGIINTR